MFSSLTIKTKLLMISLVSILIISVSVAVQSILSIKSLSQNDIENYKKEAYDRKEKELKNYVSLAMETVKKHFERTDIEKVKIEVQEDLKQQTGFIFSILEAEYKRLEGSIPNEELKEKLRKIVEGTRYGETGYFWINDLDAVIVMHPIKPQLNGKNLYDYKDKGGKQIFKEFAAVAKANGDGFVDYVWPKPGFEKPQAKVSYVKLFKPFNWVIGTGEYVSDVSAKIKKEALDVISHMRYGRTGYFWINDSHSKMIMHPIKPSLDGKDLSKTKDKAGKFLFNEMSKVANANSQGGLVKYMWPKPGFTSPQQKLSYVQRFKEWDWIIGTGVYVDDIETAISNMEKRTTEEIDSTIMYISLFTLILIIVIYVLYTFLIKGFIINPLEHLNRAIEKLSLQNSDKEIEKKSDDEIGRVIDSFNKYIRDRQRDLEEDSKVIAEVEDVIKKVNNGFYVYKVEKVPSSPQIMKLKDSINSMIDSTNEKLEDINNILLSYGNSEFNYKISKYSSSNGIVGSIFTSTKELGSTISEFLSMITTTGEKLNRDTDVLSSSAFQLSTSANEQATSLEETAAAVEEITSIIKSSNEKVGRMSILANDLNASAKEGQDLASKTTKAMEDIDTQVNSINDAITVIDQIAFQTNILSLNAAVEAATAGEAGKGFAVVAQEVRNLASRSAEAAKEIKDIVESATNKANEGKVIADNMIGGYNELNSKISETINLIADVTSGSKEQETGIIQINDVINSLDQTTQKNASSASQISSLAEEVSSLSDDLLRIADRAKFNERKKAEICDVDLVFTISKLKNDHIIFKNDSFAKVGEKTNWTVKSHNECDFGKWINEQEGSRKSFTKSSNWSKMKEYHVSIHNVVQEYINENAIGADNEKLEEISSRLEVNTSSLFDMMDQVKVDYCRDYEQSEGNSKKEDVLKKSTFEKQELKPKSFEKQELKPKSFEKQELKPKSFETKKVEPIKPMSSSTITAHDSNDDEWESF